MSTSPSPSGVHASAHGLGVGRLPGLHATCPVEADVLEVDVGDAVGVGRDGHGVTADEEVPGVEAEPDAAARDDPVGLLAALDHGADVGVQGGGETASCGGLP